MTPEKLRAWATTVIDDYDCEGTDCDCDRPKYAALARAALALAELMPVLDEWVDEWVDESCVLDDIDRTLLAAWTKAKESL